MTHFTISVFLLEALRSRFAFQTNFELFPLPCSINMTPSNTYHEYCNNLRLRPKVAPRNFLFQFLRHGTRHLPSSLAFPSSIKLAHSMGHSSVRIVLIAVLSSRLMQCLSLAFLPQLSLHLPRPTRSQRFSISEFADGNAVVILLPLSWSRAPTRTPSVKFFSV